jgi:hypothetical protein
MPQYETLFRVQRSPDNELSSIGNPNLTLAKTVSYELGYDHIIADDFLVQLSGFYKDITDQQNTTEYNGIYGIKYTKTTSNDYEDIRGLEITLRKTSGRWWSGFANYTYQVTTSGSFGGEKTYEDPTLQKEYEQKTANIYQDHPVPRPYARANVSFYTPNDIGPSLLGHNLFGGFIFNVLLDWQAGEWITYNPKNVSGILNNVQSVDYFNSTLRLTKTVALSKMRIQFLVDVSNVLNIRRLWETSDQKYRESLHLPESDGYDNIPGDDKLGDYRKPGVAYQPMKWQKTIDRDSDTGKPQVIYYEGDTGNYLRYEDEVWTEVDQDQIDQILEDKAYIDMPNASTFWFLDPRKIYYGVRLSFDLN